MRALITIALLVSGVLGHLHWRTSERDLPPRPELDPVVLAERILAHTNEERWQRGLDPLDPDEVLSQAAGLHADHLMELGRLSHYGNRFARARDRVREVCRREGGDVRACLRRYVEPVGAGRVLACCGENLVESLPHTGAGVAFYWSSDDQGPYRVWTRDVRWFQDEDELARDLVQRWMQSPGHRRNLLQPDFDVVGHSVGWNGRKYVAVQVFAPLH